MAAGDPATARESVDAARALLDGAVGAVNLERLAREIDGRLTADAAPAADAEGGELTDRELAVLRRLTGAGSAREIAADLYVSHNTVKTQIRAIYRKLGVGTREDAVARARERGLLPRTLAGR
jgi:LuxR family maltose regulon positive regulatory protein